MVLITACAVGAATYIISQQQSNKKPAFDMNGKTSVDLLNFEYELAAFEPPVATITFFEGDPKIVGKYLRKRIFDEIIKANPWLSGWLHLSSKQNKKDDDDDENKDDDDDAGARAGTGDDEDENKEDDDEKPVVRLWYDKDGIDVAPGLFKEFASSSEEEEDDKDNNNIIQLSDDTPYHLYDTILSKHNIIVQPNTKLIGSNDSLWRVSIIPDYKSPTTKFALVVSMSHVGGDAASFFQVYNMLDMKSPVIELNCMRNVNYVNLAKKRMGSNEFNFLKNAMQSPGWGKFASTKSHKHLFIIKNKWLKDQKVLYSSKHTDIHGKLSNWLNRARVKTTLAATAAKKKEKRETASEAVEESINCFNMCGDNNVFKSWASAVVASPAKDSAVLALSNTNEDEEADKNNISDNSKEEEAKEEEKKDKEHNGNKTLSNSNSMTILTAGIGGTDIIDDKAKYDVSNNDVIVSWFWRSVSKPSVGLMLYNFRNRVPHLTDYDMGNYIKPIPYTRNDYKSPELIRQSIQYAKRVGGGGGGSQSQEKMMSRQSVFNMFAMNKTSTSALPKYSIDMSISITSNWVSSQKKINVLHLPSVSKQIKHLPYLSMKHFDTIPKRLSVLLLWNTGGRCSGNDVDDTDNSTNEKPQEIGALVIGSKPIMDCIDKSDIVGKTIAKF